MPKPHTTVVLAMSADGKIADYARSAARFGSVHDQAHLERQVAQADAVLFGAATLRAYGTTRSVQDPTLQQQRLAQGKPIQPIQIVCSATGRLDRQARFFTQPVPRWLLTQQGTGWGPPAFDRVLVSPDPINWCETLAQFSQLGIAQLVVLGGGTVVAGMFEAGVVDALWLTVCPLIFGGETAPTPVAGSGFLAEVAPQLTLLDCLRIEDEIFLHYQVRSLHPPPANSFSSKFVQPQIF